MDDKLIVEPYFQFNNFKNNQIWPDSNELYKGLGIDMKGNFEVIWKELSYKVRHRLIRKKFIFNTVSGYFKSGQILAILGPSGCGKSSLLGCLAGYKRKGVTGSITISTKRKMKFAVIGQEDYLEKKLTVMEALMYASKLKNIQPMDHKLNVNNVLKRLDIETTANVRTNRCSGGQRKRISIAMELVSRPNILILDEPTSGLDSVTTWQLINTLIELTKQSEPIAIVATIHQPSGRLFKLFNSVYIMSYDGNCIYHGSPHSMVNFLGQYGLRCPQYHNPADYVLEVASKEYGNGKVMLLSTIMKIEALDLIPFDHKIQSLLQYNTCSDVWTLTKRTFKLSVRDIFMLPLRVFAHIASVGLIILFWGSESGKLSGCPDDFIAEGGSYADNFVKTSENVYENFSCIVFTTLILWFLSIFAVVLTFPLEMNIFLKEYRNGWFSVYSYYMAKVIVDIFWQLTIPNIVALPSYIFTGQPYKGMEWRLYYYTVACLLLCMSSSSSGLIVGTYLMKWPTAAAFIGCCLGFPLFLFSGFMIPIKDMPEVFQWVAKADYLTYAVQSATVAIYGFGRCDEHQSPQQNRTEITDLIPQSKINEIASSDKINGYALLTTMSYFSGQTSTDTQSIVMTRMGYEDNDLYYGIAMLCLQLIIMKVLTYYVLVRKVNSFNR